MSYIDVLKLLETAENNAESALEKLNEQFCNQDNFFPPRDYPFDAKRAENLAERDWSDPSKSKTKN